MCIYIYIMHIALSIFLFNTAFWCTIFRNKQPRHLKKIDSCRMLRGQKALSIDFILLNGFEIHLLDDSELNWSTKNETLLLLVKPAIFLDFQQHQPLVRFLNQQDELILYHRGTTGSTDLKHVLEQNIRSLKVGTFFCAFFPMILESIFIGFNDQRLYTRKMFTLQ